MATNSSKQATCVIRPLPEGAPNPLHIWGGVYKVMPHGDLTALALCYSEDAARHICALFNGGLLEVLEDQKWEKFRCAYGKLSAEDQAYVRRTWEGGELGQMLAVDFVLGDRARPGGA